MTIPPLCHSTLNEYKTPSQPHELKDEIKCNNLDSLDNLKNHFHKINRQKVGRKWV